MNRERIIDVLGIPSDAIVDKRVPKKLLIEHGVPTSSDKRQIQDGIEELLWIAALKPTNIGVPAYKDENREYLEIAVLAASLREKAKYNRISELIHRAIPYPVVLLMYQGNSAFISLAHKRWSQSEANKMVIEEMYNTAAFQLDAPDSNDLAFFNSLAISGMSKQNMFALYQGWIDRINALEATKITGRFEVPDSLNRSIALRQALDVQAQLQKQISALRAKAAKEKQINRRVELNLEIKRLEAQLKEAIDSIKPGED